MFACFDYFDWVMLLIGLANWKRLQCCGCRLLIKQVHLAQTMMPERIDSLK